MEYPSEDQLNKLISAYNDDYESIDVDTEMRKSVLQIAEFEQKLKSKGTSKGTVATRETEKPAERTAVQFDQIRIPELPEHMRKKITEEKLAQIEREEVEEEPEVDREPAPPAESKREVQVQYLTDNEAVDRKLKELVAKNKGLGLSLQKEQSANAQLKEKAERLSHRVEELRKVAEGGQEQALKLKMEEQADRLRKTEEKSASLQLRVGTLESELAKALKVLKREVGEKLDVEELLREDSSWVGRAQQIELLKAKVQRLRSKVEGVPEKPPQV